MTAMTSSFNSFRFAALCIGLGLVAGLGDASALDYPTKPVRWVVGYPPAARPTSPRVSWDSGCPSGWASSSSSRTGPAPATISAPSRRCARRADGYTLFLVNPANAINATLYEKLGFNFIRDIAPVAGVIRVPNVMEVNPSVPAKTVPEFIAYAKANPGKINLASSGIGTSIHMSGELFKMMTGVNMLHVPYRGSAPMLTDLLGGQVQITFDNMPSSIDHIRAGKLRALAVTTTSRSEALPDVPVVADFVPGYEASAWFGMGAPKGTPAGDHRQAQQGDQRGAQRSRSCRKKLAELGGMLMPGTPADFGKVIAEETEKWGKVVKFSGATPE